MKKRYYSRIDREEDREIVEKLKKINIVTKNYSRMINVSVYFGDPRIPEVLKIMKTHSPIIGTDYSREDYANAKILQMEPDWLYEYPQPDDDHSEWQKLVYDLKNFCSECDMGKIQKAPFHMLHEPRWRNYQVFGLNWVFDEFFVRPEIWESIFKKRGIGKLPVINHGTNNELKNVVQLQVDKVLECPLDMKEYAYNVCKKCNRKKYVALPVGYFPKPKNGILPYPMMRSQEWFGEGHEARNAILVTNELYREINEHNVRRLYFRPTDSI